jgi:NAD(P)-dependent dehydrogenase (short-subunit alcohol dehydrogenase family)
VTSNNLGTLAVVTDGASGIGYALVNAYGRRGASDTGRGVRVWVRRQLVGHHITNVIEPSRSRDTLGHRTSSFEIAFRRSERETVDGCRSDD